MRKIKRWRYYCDFCNKGGGHSGWMKIHEKHCTLNPNRQCRMCEVADIPQQSVNELIEKFKSVVDKQSLESFINDDKKALEELREITEGCPACMLAVIRQYPDAIVAFDFKEESKSFWRNMNDRHAEEECY